MKAATCALPVIEVTEPCAIDWDAMAGDEQKRFCAHCQRFVHNLSAMTEAEAADLLCRDAGRLCVRYAPAADGSPLTLGYRDRGIVNSGVTRRCMIGGLIAAALSSIGIGFWQRQRYVTKSNTPPPTPMIMGAVAPMRVVTPTNTTPPPSSGGGGH
jgi:hypothetical protein